MTILLTGTSNVCLKTNQPFISDRGLLAWQAAHGDMDNSVQTDWCGCVAGQRPS